MNIEIMNENCALHVFTLSDALVSPPTIRTTKAYVVRFYSSKNVKSRK